MQIKDLYDKYEIMPQLREHQLRVAGIGKLITDSWEDRVLADKCVKACLLHDMGNIVKFSNLVDPKWIEVRERYKREHGQDAYTATYSILKDAGLSEYIDILKEEGKMYEKKVGLIDFQNASSPALIVLYTDLRVTPIGVVTMQERIDDLKSRYNKDRVESVWGEVLEEYVQSLTKVEVAKITEKDVEPLFDELLTMTV